MGDEVVVPRKPVSIGIRGGTWKVTARYSVQVSDTEEMPCVRVRGPGFIVMHFSLPVFRRMFKSAPPPRARRRSTSARRKP